MRTNSFTNVRRSFKYRLSRLKNQLVDRAGRKKEKGKSLRLLVVAHPTAHYLLIRFPHYDVGLVQPHIRYILFHIISYVINTLIHLYSLFTSSSVIIPYLKVKKNGRLWTVDVAITKELYEYKYSKT